VAWDAAGVTVATADGEQQVKSAELLHLEAAAETNPAEVPTITIELVDNTRFAIGKFDVADRRAVIATPFASRPMTVPTGVIRRVEFRAPSDALTEAWRRVDEREAAGDALIIVKGDGEAFDYLTGVVGTVTDDQVLFDWEGQKVPIKRNKIAGIAFYHGESEELADPKCVLSTTDGMTFPARDITLSGGTLRVITPSGLKFDLGLNTLASADFSAGKLAYLSDLKPASSTWTPRIAVPKAATIASEFGMPRMNASFSGSELTLAWPNEALATGREIRPYAKGLALRSRSELNYRLPTGMKRFSATAGIDPATTEQGHVVLEIRADDRVVWEGEIDGKHPPVEIDVELKSARRLQIRVDYGRNLDYGDRLNLVEARVSK
jgi:hypothetical protein